mmetsp:Transcript_39042/g.102878  ORF Transcript_39042/g.102878 Transcript_39042/m.102878 type:complete len:176 (+) Transcript_39042:8-535(+)
MADTDIEQVIEICGCTREQARMAVEAAGPGGVEVAVDLILSSMSSHWSSASDQPSSTPCKLVCLVRQDLDMGVGKVAAQVAHGALGAYRSASSSSSNQDTLRRWQEGGEATIVLGVSDEAELRGKLAEASQLGLLTFMVADAGRTEVIAGAVTVGTIGPDYVDKIDAVTGRLRLL